MNSSVPSTPHSNIPSGPGYDYNSILQGVKSQTQPFIDQANQNIGSSINNVNNAYSSAITQGNTLLGNITTQAQNQIQQGTTANNQAGSNAQDAMLNAQQQTEKQLGLNNIANQGAVTASAVTAGFGGTTASQNGGGQDPFVAAEQAAANAPYSQSLQSLNASTQSQIAQMWANITQSNTSLASQVTSADIGAQAQIGSQLLQLAPEQASTIANLNVQMAQLDQSYQQGEITQATAIAGLQQQSYVQNLQAQAAVTTANANMIAATGIIGYNSDGTPNYTPSAQAALKQANAAQQNANTALQQLYASRYKLQSNGIGGYTLVDNWTGAQISNTNAIQQTLSSFGINWTPGSTNVNTKGATPVESQAKSSLLNTLFNPGTNSHVNRGRGFFTSVSH